MNTETKTVGEVIREGMGDVISQELADKITTMYNEAVEHEVESRIHLTVENELDKMDAAHSAELEKLLESIDADHLEKTKKLMEAMDENYTRKLIAVANKYEKELHESAEAFNTRLNESISKFLDLYLDDAFPAQTVQEAVENTKAAKQLAQIRDVIGIDASYVSESVKSAVLEAKEQIDSLRSEVASLKETNESVSTELASTKQKLVLEEKTAGLPSEKRDFIKRRLADRSVEDIEANYNYVCEMFDADQKEMREALREESVAKSTVVSNKIDKPQVVKESVEDESIDQTDPFIKACLDSLSNSVL